MSLSVESTRVESLVKIFPDQVKYAAGMLIAANHICQSSRS
jgi:hypothetical protein